MRADFKVVIDACVLANFGVCDVLLRLAEKPRLYQPRWSAALLEETYRTQIGALGWPPEIADSFKAALHETFPEASIAGYEHLIDRCVNDAKDRHVLACAIHCRAEVILTFNLRDFSVEALAPWGVQARHPQDYLLTLYSMEPTIVLHKLEEIARKRQCGLEDHLVDLGRFLPAFAQKVIEDVSGNS